MMVFPSVFPRISPICGHFTKNSVLALLQHCHLASLFGRRPTQEEWPRRTDGFDSVTLPVTKLYWTSSPAAEAEEAAAAVSVLANNTCPSPLLPSLLLQSPPILHCIV